MQEQAIDAVDLLVGLIPCLVGLTDLAIQAGRAVLIEATGQVAAIKRLSISELAPKVADPVTNAS